MNNFVQERFTEKIHRLAIGLEPFDAERRTRITHPIQVTADVAPLGKPHPPIEHHDTCLHTVRYWSMPKTSGVIALRFFDCTSDMYHASEDLRRFVPRRLEFPIQTIEDAENNVFQRRIRRPVLFPGAAYNVDAGATGIRGLVTHGEKGPPARWVRVEARLLTQGGVGQAVVARTHGDDRGEFLLILPSAAVPLDELPSRANPLKIVIHIFAWKTPPTPTPKDLPGIDQLWDLPVEKVPLEPVGPDDPFSKGEALPAGYEKKSAKEVECEIAVLKFERFKIV